LPVNSDGTPGVAIGWHLDHSRRVCEKRRKCIVHRLSLDFSNMGSASGLRI
jgi:hypothetical protein